MQGVILCEVPAKGQSAWHRFSKSHPSLIAPKPLEGGASPFFGWGEARWGNQYHRTIGSQKIVKISYPPFSFDR